MPLNLRLSPQLKGYELRICRSLSSGSLKGLSLHSTIVKNWSSYSWKKAETFHSGFENQWIIDSIC